MILFRKTKSITCFNRIAWTTIPAYACAHTQLTSLSPAWSTHRYLRLVHDLRTPPYLQGLLQQYQQLVEQTGRPLHTFQGLRIVINDLLYVMRLIGWANAYHSNIPQLKGSLNKVQKCMELAFSQKVSQTHENMQEQSRESFEAINFHVYFQLQEKVPAFVSQLYFNSYMHLLRDRWPLELMRATEALGQGEAGQLQTMIMERSQIYLKQIVNKIQSSSGRQCLNESEMAIYLSFYKKYIGERSVEEIARIKTMLLAYLESDSDAQNSFLHLQNIIYILYLLTGDIPAYPEVVEWLSRKYSSPNQNATAIYLGALFSHEDKLSCLKLDFWASIVAYLRQHSSTRRDYNQVEYVGTDVIRQLHGLNFTTWKYKYVVWMLNTVINDLQLDSEIVSTILQVVVKNQLASHKKLSSFLYPYISYTCGDQLPAQTLKLEYLIAKWLSIQSSEALLSQPAEVLCEILPHADRHPALHVIYLPYLQRLLQLSLGRFEWSVLNQLYYFGLRWKAEASQEGYWRMQYVRRYIMNEYAVMGILRRQIPEDSYFYKIHEETTPDRFYGDLSKR